jgi:hypothetical protein
VDRLAARLPGVVAFLLGGIVERAGFAQFAVEEDGLRPGGVDPVFKAARIYFPFWPSMYLRTTASLTDPTEPV